MVARALSCKRLMRVTKAEFLLSSAKLDQCPAPDKPEFAFIGRSNVGKSSLINYLTDRKGLAKTSARPGKTQLINHFIINEAWYLVDLPGYGYAKTSKTVKSVFQKLIYDYFEGRSNMVNAFVLLDCRLEPQANDLKFMNWMGENGIPFAMVFTKVDKLSSTALRKSLELYQKKMLESWEELPPLFSTSAESRHGRQELLKYVDFCITASPIKKQKTHP
jgi:GTP-binding protein